MTAHLCCKLHYIIPFILNPRLLLPSAQPAVAAAAQPQPHAPTPTDCSCVRALLQVMTICKILEGILPKESVRGAPPPDKKLLEYHFVFACVWAFGGSMLVDKVGAGANKIDS